MTMRVWSAALVGGIGLMLAMPAPAQRYSDSFSFLEAVKKGDGAKVTALISEPGSTVVNAREPKSGDGALHIVARDRNYEWLSFLLGKGAKPDLENAQGNTPLAIAAQLGWVEGAQLLISRGIDVNKANNAGETPLILAVHKRDLPMVRLLLGAGADPKRADSVAGYSALDYARQDARSAAIVKLLEEGPSKTKREVSGPVF
jgi:ankyrin repeat protein